MDAWAKQSFIRQKAAERKIKWTRHALNALVPEPFSVRDAEAALQQAHVIEDYPYYHRHLPDCLILAFAFLDEPIHCVVALNEMHDYVLIITVYQPTEQEWEDDWRTRK